MAVMIKLNMHFTNPFDFERPVKNPKLFAGRQKELDEIDYYLELMLGENPTYHNLSIIGERASGKTSFLNMIQYMAEKKEMLAVKISLNNEISENEVLVSGNPIIITSRCLKDFSGLLFSDICKSRL